MAGIKSLEELKALRDKYKENIIGRDTSDSENKIRISVGMATCGIASGARDTINAIIDEVSKEKLTNVVVVQSGCLGYCYAEPTVEVRVPGKEPVLYGNINAERGREIIKKHIKNGEIQKDWIIERTFKNI
ncbi:NAD(P)-dependent iron-only hydrogenase iron-sulfur protein [Caloramator quimbayensis]|uniref:NAD(P)-dependent iron-only hydrogenase iron-sulfur protein n=1 Tax=Caloramator quimbayensis TaxID=1147123 RepID=A0A1T4X4K9_9CLOT|nr:(2Fe-2S) ferredoxin domain-containing protein [Caloramator quimbayensis]SKA84583.1 NAD(P)-dependent iron-only hydrogenase iron-sulfur protein [Caloramator quimbayensis]